MDAGKEEFRARPTDKGWVVERYIDEIRGDVVASFQDEALAKREAELLNEATKRVGASHHKA